MAKKAGGAKQVAKKKTVKKAAVKPKVAKSKVAAKSAKPSKEKLVKKASKPKSEARGIKAAKAPSTKSKASGGKSVAETIVEGIREIVSAGVKAKKKGKKNLGVENKTSSKRQKPDSVKHAGHGDQKETATSHEKSNGKGTGSSPQNQDENSGNKKARGKRANKKESHDLALPEKLNVGGDGKVTQPEKIEAEKHPINSEKATITNKVLEGTSDSSKEGNGASENGGEEIYSSELIRATLDTINYFINDTTDAAPDECSERGCDNLATTIGFCRLHYIANWKDLQRKKEVLSEGKLGEMVQDLIARFPLKFIEAMRDDLSDEKSFYMVLKNLNIDSNFDFDEGEDLDMDSDSDIAPEARAASVRSFDDDTEI